MPDSVLIDTSVWIDFFRKKGSHVSALVQEYLKNGRACWAGPIIIELYQGAKTQKEVQVLEDLLGTISYIEITMAYYHKAGIISQKAARNGKSFSVIDMIIAIVAHEEHISLFSLDTHFQEISEYCTLSLIPLPSIG